MNIANYEEYVVVRYAGQASNPRTLQSRQEQIREDFADDAWEYLGDYIHTSHWSAQRPDLSYIAFKPDPSG